MIPLLKGLLNGFVFRSILDLLDGQEITLISITFMIWIALMGSMYYLCCLNVSWI